MAYKYTKGSVKRGDIYNEDDTQGNTYLDWDEDYIGMVTSGSATLVVSGSAVGIGTTSPQMSLEILDPTGQLRLAENDTDNATLSHRLGKFTISVCGGGGDPMVVQAGAVGVVDGGNQLTPAAMFHASSSYDNVSLLRLDAATSTGILFVTGSAKVGINTTSPSVALDVHYTGSGDPTNLDDDKGGGEVVYFGSGSLAAGALHYLNEDGGWAETSAATTGAGHDQLLGIPLGTDPSADGVLLKGYFHVDTYLSGAFRIGKPIYVCSSSVGQYGFMSGAAPTAADSYIRVVGYGTSVGNVIYFNPDSIYVELS